jgi:hypothetical protein
VGSNEYPRRLLDFFPGYQSFGLREIALTENPLDLLGWMSAITARSFDSLGEENRRVFAEMSVRFFSDPEFRAALTRLHELLSQLPPTPDEDAILAFPKFVEALTDLLARALDGPAIPELFAELADTVHHGAAAIALLLTHGHDG